MSSEILAQKKPADKRPDTCLYLKHPATRWTDSFPVGNGRLGAMVLGTPAQDRLALNHEELWRGVNRHRNTPEVDPERLAEIREALFARDFFGARKLCDQYLSGPDPVEAAPALETIQPYQPVGDLLITQPGGEYAVNYERLLDLNTATAITSFTINDVRYHRECYASVPDQVLILHLSADQPGTLTCGLRLERCADPDCHLTQWRDDDLFGFQGRFIEDIEFAAQARVLTLGGTIEDSGNSDIIVRDADEITVCIAMAVAADGDEPDSRKACNTILNRAPRTEHELRTRHLTEYQALWNRCMLNLPCPEGVEKMALDERLNRRADHDDPALDALYFHYGRYLLLSSSRACRFPANLQGIWSADLRPVWNSDFHIDINLEMEYWPAERANLPECTAPLFNYLEAMTPGAREAAANYYCCRGIHMGTGDRWQLYRYLAAGWDIWPSGGAWLAQHFWWHWEHSLDIDFLREHAYPFLKENAKFFEDFLVQDSQGRLVTNPSQSPENTFKGGPAPVTYCVAPTMDLVFAREIFTRCIAASKLLETDEDQREIWRDLLDKLPPFQIGQHGQLQEWLDDETELEPGHRHLSHLIGVYPGETMTPQRLPEFFQAAKVSLERRRAAGTGQSGWSRSWCAALWARFGETEKAYADLSDLIANHTTASLLNTHPITTHGGLAVQLDGSLGGTAAIMEMLLQDYTGKLRLLPALPDAWSNGEIRGLHAAGGYTLDMTWRDKRLCRASIQSDWLDTASIILARALSLKIETGGEVSSNKNDQEYDVRFDRTPGTIELICD